MARQSSPIANDNARCVICGRPRVADYDPFCSRRCADVDLYKWLKGGYVIPGQENADEQATPTEE